MNIVDLFDPDQFDAAVAAGYVRVQTHPTLPYSIANYSEKAQYEHVWNDATLTCRGLIYDDGGEVLARPYRKFFNLGDERHTGPLDLMTPAVVTDKLDGSMAVSYPTPDGLAIATRGSFTSEQALHATELLRSKYAAFTGEQGTSYLWEIIYPSNRIVVDYGDLDDLILHGAIDITTGHIRHAFEVTEWEGPRASQFPYATLADALAAEPRPNAEGVVVTLGTEQTMLKIKQSDYIALHALITNASARVVWRHLAVLACAETGLTVEKMVRLLHTGPDRIQRVLDAGAGWYEQMTERVPDEFFTWLKATHDGLVDAQKETVAYASTEADYLLATYPGDRRGLAAAAFVRNDRNMAGIVFGLIDGYDTTAQTWLLHYPDGDETPFKRSEAVA